MVYPTKSTRQYDYQGYQVSNPTRPLPGDKVNADLNVVNRSVGEIVDFLKTTLRSDGKLADNTVGLGQLDDSFKLGFSYPTTWAPHTDYTVDATVFYQNKFLSALVEHTSTDVFDASKWQEIVDFGAQSVADAAASAVAAEASQLAAAASETNAATSETNAAASAVASAADAAAVASHVGQAIASSMATLAAVDTAVFDAAYLSAPMRTGVWLKKLVSDYTADIAADTLNGFTLTSTDNSVYVWVRDVPDGKYQVDWFRTPGDDKAADTAAAIAAFSSVPSGSKVKLGRFKEYDLGEMSVTSRGHLHIDGNLAFINNTTQVATGAGVALPLLRVFVRTQDYDLTIENLFLQGPRLSSDTTVGDGGYGGDPLNPGSGFSSGIDIPIGRNVVLRNVVVTGTFYAGIEAHYCKSLLIDNCGASNHGYAGILTTDTVLQRILDNTVDDTGSTPIDDGYGISAGTSYNDPGYAYGNQNFIIRGNKVTRSKRKGIDVHSGMSGIVEGNTVKGFGYSGIYAVCEDVSKKVGDVTVCNNHVYGDSTFLSGVINHSCIYVGAGAGSVNDTNMKVHGNHLGHLSAPLGILTQNNSTGDTGQAAGASVQNNTFADCTFVSNAIRTDSGTKVAKKVLVTGNDIEADCALPIFIQSATDAISSLNVYRGTATGSAGTVTQFSSVTNGHALNNMFNGTLGE